MSFFSVDGAFYRFIQRFWDLVKINFLWLIFSIPIITMGGATIAAHDICLKMIDEQEGYVARQFVQSFKKNFKDGIPYGILFLFCCYVVWLDFSLFNQVEGNPIILLIFGMVAVAIFYTSFLFTFALQARYKNGLIHTLKNSADIFVRYFLRNLILTIVLLIEIFVIFWNNWTMIVGAIIGPACIILTVCGFASYYFKQIEKEPGALA